VGRPGELRIALLHAANANAECKCRSTTPASGVLLLLQQPVWGLESSYGSVPRRSDSWPGARSSSGHRAALVGLDTRKKGAGRRRSAVGKGGRPFLLTAGCTLLNCVPAAGALGGEQRVRSGC